MGLPCHDRGELFTSVVNIMRKESTRKKAKHTSFFIGQQSTSRIVLCLYVGEHRDMSLFEMSDEVKSQRGVLCQKCDLCAQNKRKCAPHKTLNEYNSLVACWEVSRVSHMTHRDGVHTREQCKQEQKKKTTSEQNQNINKIQTHHNSSTTRCIILYNSGKKHRKDVATWSDMPMVPCVYGGLLEKEGTFVLKMMLFLCQFLLFYRVFCS